nr:MULTISPECIES: hypothetical protein [Mycobacteroides]
MPVAVGAHPAGITAGSALLAVVAAQEASSEHRENNSRYGPGEDATTSSKNSLGFCEWARRGAVK